MKRISFLFVLAMALVFHSVAFAQAPTAPQNQQTITPEIPQQRSISPVELFALVAGEAEKGNPQAMLQMGVLYERGIGVPLNFGKALDWYRKAATAELAEGYYNVAVCYEIGMGTTVEPQRALANFEKAAAMGLGVASYKLAAMHFAGTGTAKNEAKAVSYLLQAANAGYAPAANEMGIVYLQGQYGQKQDNGQAMTMFTKAAELGNLEAIKNIAVLYKDGLGVSASPEKSLMWYLIAQKGGYPLDLTNIITELKNGLSESKINKAQADADAWLADFEKRTAAARQN